LLELRMATRPAHLAYLESHVAEIVQGGALLDPEGKPRGSLLVIDVADHAAATAFAAGDPYAVAGLFESALVRPFRAVFQNGARTA
jgi:uncharacterized protein